MKKQKYLASALAALTMLTSAAGFSTFADEVPENSDTATEIVTETETETVTEEVQQAEETTEEESGTIIDKLIKSEKKRIRKLANSAKRSEKKCKPAEQALTEGEVPAEENASVKPERKAGKRAGQETADYETSAEENTFSKPERKAGRHGRKSAEQTVDESTVVEETVTEETTEEITE